MPSSSVPVPGSSAERGQVTRERLLAAVVPLVGEVGWGGVTTRLVAERAGVNPGLVHYHFASVSELLIAGCLSVIRPMLDESAQRLAVEDDVAEGVDWILAQMTGFSSTDPVSVAVSEAFLASTRVPELRVQLAELVIEFRRVVASWLNERGHIEDAEACAALFAAALDGIVVHRALDPSLDFAALAAPIKRMLGVQRPSRKGHR